MELGLPAGELGVDELREVADRRLGSAGCPWYVGYRVRLAVK